MKRGIVVVCSVLLLPGWGMAQGLQPLQQVPAPNFDVNAICGAFAKPGAGMNGCLAQQQQAQAQIQAMWPQLSPYDQQIAGIYGDYVDMLPTVRQLYQHELLILTLENKVLPRHSPRRLLGARRRACRGRRSRRVFRLRLTEARIYAALGIIRGLFLLPARSKFSRHLMRRLTWKRMLPASGSRTRRIYLSRPVHFARVADQASPKRSIRRFAVPALWNSGIWVKRLILLKIRLAYNPFTPSDLACPLRVRLCLEFARYK